MATELREQLAVFLRDIRDNPDDDTPRLVLADWLQEQGDPRGEFMAVMLQRERLADDEAYALELRHRERELLREHIFDWLGPVVDLSSDWSFHRGFLHITARAEKFLTTEVEELLQSDSFLWLESLRLLRVRPGDLARLAGSPILEAITTLDLSENHLTDGDVVAFHNAKRLRSLRRLILQGIRVSPVSVVLLAKSQPLQGLLSLDLRGTRLTPELRALLRECYGERVLVGRANE